MPLVLVVDDSMLVRHTVCRFLEERGHEVEAATNGVEALEILSRRKPDLIITDLEMPRMHGAELIQALHDDASTARIPIIVLSGRSSGAMTTTALPVRYVIYKNIDIIEQLEQALKHAFPSAK
jgi:CheY-like chemotaxis protein